MAGRGVRRRGNRGAFRGRDRDGVRFRRAEVPLLPARGGHRVRARGHRRAGFGLAAGVHRGHRAHPGAGLARTDRRFPGSPDRRHRKPVGRDHRRADVRLRHDPDARLRQPAAGALGQRQPARAPVRTGVRGHRAGEPSRAVVAAARHAGGPLDDQRAASAARARPVGRGQRVRPRDRAGLGGAGGRAGAAAGRARGPCRGRAGRCPARWRWAGI